MSTKLVANASIGACLPTTFGANLDLQTDLAARLAAALAAITNLQSQLSVAITASLTPPKVAIDAALVAQLAAAVTLPSFAVNLAAIVPDIQAALAKALAELAAIQAKLDIAVAFSLGFATAGMRVYRYDGPLQNMGGELSSFTAGAPGDGGMGQTSTVSALMFVTDIPAAGTALSFILGV